MNLQKQLANQLEGYKKEDIVPCNLKYGSTTMPVYAKAGNILSGKMVYHLETLQKINVGTGKLELAKTYWRVTAKGELVENGYDIVNSEDWNTWLNNHENKVVL